MFQFKLPDLGEGIHEGQIVSVLVQEGDSVDEYQPMLEVETDKAAVEVPSPVSGVIKKLHVEPGDLVKVGQVLVEIEETGAGAAAPAEAEVLTASAAPRSAVVSAEAASTVARDDGHGAAIAVAAPEKRSGPIPAAPAVRKLAREMGVDLAQAHPTGPNGRVLREDVERVALSGRGGAAETLGAPPIEIPGAALPDFTQHGGVRREAVSQIRKTIAKQMTRAWLNVPRVTHCDSADLTELDRNRKLYNERLAPEQPKLTITAIVLKAVAASLRSFPMLNCSFDAEMGEIVYKEYVHLGIAVDTPRGLVVPVMRDVERKSLPQIAKELSGIAERARSAKFEIAELRGATFTITNVGVLGGSFVTPMVNFPEVGILALGRGAMQAVVREGQVVPRLMLPLSLSFDHRVVDGADGARFTRDVIDSLENPLRLISL